MTGICVAFVDLRNHHAKAEDVHHRRHLHALAAHLLVDAVEVLLAPHHGGADALLAQRAGQPGLNLVDDAAHVAELRAHRAREHLVTLRIKVGEGQVLKFHAQEVDTETLRDGRVDLQGFQRDAAAFRRIDHA